MATILRSSKYIRCLNVFARRIVVGHDNGNIASKCLAPQAQCINSYLTKSYATVQAVQRNDHFNFDRHIAKLDENVQRYGRVYKPEVDEVLSKVRDTGFITSLDGLLLIRCCGELMVDAMPATRNQLVEDIWSTLEALKIPMDVSHFNALLRVYLENNHEFSPIEILTKMKDKGIEPNRVTYQRLILYNCKKGNIEGATKILEFMREKGIPLNENVFNALITGHSEANDMESAKNIINVMKDAGVGPCSSTYTALLCAYAKRGDMDSIKNLIADCGKRELYLHDKELFEVIQVLAANGYNSECDEIFPLMPKSPNYNYDSFHAILKVLDVGNVEVAMKILPTMNKRKNAEEDQEENENGTFLIRKLVNAKFPPEKIVEACDQLEKQGQHAKAFFVALERSLLNSDTVLSVPLLKAWKERGGTIREHYLWPLFAAHGKASNYQGIEDTIKLMVEDLKVTPGVETITDYILPYTLGKWDDVVTTLKNFGISHNMIVNSIATRMLIDNKIRKTATFMMNYPSNYEGRTFYRPLAEALKNTGDVRSFVAILRILQESAINRSSSEGESSDIQIENVVDSAVRKALLVLSPRKYEIVNELVDLLIDGGMSLSPATGNHLRDFYDDNITPEISEKIEKLTTGGLVLTPLSEFKTQMPADESGEIHGGQENFSHMNQFSVKRQQLSSYIIAKDAKAVETLTEELEAQNFKFSPAVCAQIIDVFCSNEKLEQAEKWLNKFKTENPADTIDLQKATRYAALLIKNGRLDDAINFITETPRKEQPENQGPGLRRLVKTLLDVAAETGNVEFTEKMLDTLVNARYATIDNYMLGSLVKVHLARNDLEGALNAFEKACQTHRCTPLKNDLSKKFIDAEDANSLQRLTDLSTQVHGESNSLVDLVLSFIECGRLRQARKILETPGLRLRSAKLRSAAVRYIDEDKPEYLEQFFEITKGLPVLDRQELYDVLLDTYSKKNDYQRGLSLWTEMQEENAQPSQKFLKTLAELLKKNNQPIPFIHNDKMVPAAAAASSQPVHDFVVDFNEAIGRGDLDRAEKILQNAPSNHSEFSTLMSTLVEKMLVDRNDIDKATELLESLIVQCARLPRASALKAVWNSLIDAEKFDKLRKFENMLSGTTKKKFRFQKYLNRAAIKQKGVSRFLDDFEAKLTDSKKDNFAHVKNTLHFTSLLKEFKKDPSALEKFRPIAEKLSEQQIHLPINLVWCYYFEQNKPEADEVWSKHLFDSNWIVFSYLLDSSKKDNNVEVVERLQQKIASNNVISPNAKATVLTSLLDIYNANGRHEDALKVLQNESAEIINLIKTTVPSSIEALKEGLEAKGKGLPSNLDVRKS